MARSTPGTRTGRAVKLGLATALAAAAVPLSAGMAQAGGSTSSCPTTPDKCYTFTISAAPAQPKPGESATYTGRLTNLSRGGTGVQLGAVNITWSPSNAFSSVTAGSVSPTGSETYVAPNALQLRDLNLPPGATSTFTFQATSLQGQTVSFTSVAKQSNNFSGVGNDLTYSGGSVTIQISQFCSDGVTYNAYGCKGFLKTQGATITTGSTDSDGNPSVVTASLVVPPVTPAPNSPSVQLMAVRSYLGGGDTCPAVIPCAFSVQLMNKLDIEYDDAHAATLTINCGALCDPATVWFQTDEGSGITEELPPCTPLGPVPSPLTGSTACYDLSLTGGSITVHNVTHINDWRVAGLPEL
jgi:hypothetical protein